jgi:RNA polymerase sigma factor (sigma-70 family)
MEAANSVNERIVSLMPLAKSIAKKMRIDNPDLENLIDFESEAYLRLTKLVKKWGNQSFNDFRGFIAFCLFNYLKDCIRVETYRLTEPLPDDLEWTISTKDLLLDILDCCNTDIEKKIISMRAEGHTMEYIVKTLDLSLGTVKRTLDKIQLRYEGILG